MTISTYIERLLGRELTVELDGHTTDLAVIRWEELRQASAEQARRAADLSKAEIDELYNCSPDPVSEIFEYFLEEEADIEAVTSGRFLPFAVLGIGSAPAGYAELDNDGLLVVDLSRTDEHRSPVLWIRDGEAREIGERVDDLKIASVRPAHPDHPDRPDRPTG